MISKNHYLDLEDGEFKRTSAADLDSMFETIKSDVDGDHLVVHFHGGLVTREASLAMANRLSPIYRQAKAYPTFFIWNSDLYNTFKNNLDEIFSERVFNRLVQILSNFLAGKLVDVAGGRSDGRLSLDSMRDYDKSPEELCRLLDEVVNEYQELPSAIGVSPTADLHELSKEQEGQLQEILTKDGPLQREIASIAAGLRE